MTSVDAPVTPLVLGRGPKELEVFLEPTCPFSKRAFEKLEALLDLVGRENLTIRIRFNSQPWHLFSGIVTRAILAASTMPDGMAVALKAMAGVYRNRDDFEFEAHATGPNMHRTPTDILAAISDLAGIDLSEAWKRPSVEKALKWHVRYGRQNGIHSSPSFAIDRLVEPGMSSGQSIEEWAKLLGLRPVAAAAPA